VGYAAWCVQHERATRFRESPRSFYADGSCDQFIDYQPPDPAAEARARHEQQRRAREARAPKGPTFSIGDVLKEMQAQEGRGAAQGN
jgi:hypothetical protein